MEIDKSPGTDAIPIEFSKTFYECLEKDLLQLYNIFLFTEKKSIETMNQAIITLISRKGDINKLKYWRPIFVLCLDCKILTKILSNRLKTRDNVLLDPRQQRSNHLNNLF